MSVFSVANDEVAALCVDIDRAGNYIFAVLNVETGSWWVFFGSFDGGWAFELFQNRHEGKMHL